MTEIKFLQCLILRLVLVRPLIVYVLLTQHVYKVVLRS